jgi:superfamily II DNA or RNA helicase
MASVWAALGLARLQALIGESVLERLETLLPALRPNDMNPDKIYSRAGLTQIFEAFAGAALLEKAAFREELFNSLPPSQIDTLIARLKGNGAASFGDKVAYLAKKPWRNRAFAEVVTEVLDLPRDLLPSPSEVPLAEQLLEAPLRPYKTLKDYQTPVYHEALRRLGSERRRFIVQMPTGSGKTRTATEIITSFLNDSPPGTVVFWLVHAEELCEQAYEAFRDVWPHVARAPARLIRCWGSGAKIPAPDASSAFVIGSFQSLFAALTKQADAIAALRDSIGLVVIDEAHKVLAPTYQQATEALLGNSTRVMGLTATPGRGADNEEQNAALANFFFGEIVTIEAGDASVIDFLRDRRVLSETTYVPLMTARSYTLTTTEKIHVERFFDLPPGILRRIGDDDVRNIEIIKRIESEAAANRQIIFFGCSVEHSKFVCALLTFLGIKAAHVDGATPRSQRASFVEDFKQCRIQVICNYGILSTGFDAPKTDVVFIARPTGSIVLYSQMIGRGLRGPAIGGTERCTIIDVQDNIVGFSNEQAVFEHFAGYYG